MAYLSQFILFFLLSLAGAYSLRVWGKLSVAIFGIIFIPIIALMLIAGVIAGFGDMPFWSGLGAVLVWLTVQTLDALQIGFNTIPAMMAGTLIGALAGFGVKW